MRMHCTTPLQQLAIEARLNGLLGAAEYDAMFLGLRVGAVMDRVALVWANDETAAAAIEATHHGLMIAVLREMLDVPVESLNVLPVRFPFYA